MKRKTVWILLAVLGLWTVGYLGSAAQAQTPRPPVGSVPHVRLMAENLRVEELTISPDPVRTGQQAVFGVTIHNRSSWSGRVRLLIRDRDEVAVEANDVLIRPGANRVELPRTGYRFNREDHCFTVLVDIEGTWRPLDLAKRFCAEKTQGGWTLSAAVPPPAPRLLPEDLRVNELTISPDPVRTGQQVAFGVTVHNRSSWSGRVRLQIRDRDEMAVEASDVQIRPGANRLELPRSGYRFNREDHCFTVLVDIEGTWRPVDLARQFCAGRTEGGWTLSQAAPPPPPPPPAPRIHPEDLRVNELTMSPDPARTSQEVRFGVTVHNRSSWSGRVRLLIRDRDEAVVEANDMQIQPGSNRLELPWTGYRFNREDHCFTVLIDIEGTWRPLDLARQFCAGRTQGGWTLSQAAPPPPPPPPVPRLHPEDLRVNEMTMNPSPVRTGQQVRFGLTVHNRSAWTGRIRLVIRDRDEVVVEASDVQIRPGANRVEFPRTGYRFSRNDHCFTVLIDIEGTWRPVDLARKFCAGRAAGGGWILQP
jgi:hypothetical protein